MVLRLRYILFLLSAIILCTYTLLKRPAGWSMLSQLHLTPTPGARATSEVVKPDLSRVVVVARLKSEGVNWLQQELSELSTAVYTVDDPNAPLQPPKNKGHEAMVYLTYIIDHYDELPDIIVFIHSHRVTWHNNDLLDSDTSKMIKHLSNDHVAREGYFNLRCHWHPGCPGWLHLNRTDRDINKKEEAVFGKAWLELFPARPVPEVLSQPCCGQFAASRRAIHAVPLDDFIHYRDWLVNTELNDSLSGRIFEYLWQVIFKGKTTLCPAMNVCYCGGYGVCFGSAENLEAWFQLREEQRKLESEHAKVAGAGLDATNLALRIEEMKKKLQEDQAQAFERGIDPENRLLEVG